MMVHYEAGEQRIPVKMWLESVEEGAMKQAINLANLPFAFKHIALMPDCHQGYGMPIGGVLATHGVVIPNAVGVDIGCGMCAVKTSLKNIEVGDLKKIMGEARLRIPVGFEHRPQRCDESLMPSVPIITGLVIDGEYDSARKQMGTLGGGNHFIEFQKDTSGFVWIMIHSGSRNLGKKVADFYNTLAKFMNQKWHVSVPQEHDLAFLPEDTDEAQNYLSEMSYCVKFALANRKKMMDDIQNIICEQLPKDAVEFEPMINIAHNYAAYEHHFGRNVIVHRKGATLAREGTIGIIPGSQGTKSYIVKGLGNADSFTSCSHGAGRKMGRGQACRTLSLEDEIRKLDEQGIIHGIRHEKDLDEAAGAYKDISEVMKNQSDLVSIVEELTPIAVIKG